MGNNKSEMTPNSKKNNKLTKPSTFFGIIVSREEKK